MAKEICISGTPHETRLAILEDDLLTEIYYERENEYTLAGSIYKGRVTRVLPGMQSAFVELGLERDAFLYVTDFMEEQEDSADFEKVPNGNGAGRREAQPAREAQAGREPRALRSPITIEPETRPAAGAPGTPGESHSSEDESGQGTRRWRGRRGRRRGGRSQGLREAGSSTPQVPGSTSPASSFDDEVETGPTVYEEAVAHRGGQAAFSENFASRYSPASRDDIAGAATNQPIVLPGESLSRYGAKPASAIPLREGRGSAAPSSPSTGTASTYKPSTLVEVVPGWDGGAELPGESLSRYRSKATPAAPVSAASEIVEH